MAIDAVRFTKIRSVCRAGRGNHGRTNRRPSGQRRIRRVCCSTYRRKPRARGSSARATLKPDPFFTPDVLESHSDGRVRPGSATDRSADWIIEAIIEQQTRSARCSSASTPCAAPARSSAPTRRACRSRDCRRAAATISGVTGSARISSIRRDTCRCSKSFRRPDTDPAVVAAVRDFADRRLGKNVVVAKDTPGFIANHVAMHGLVRIFEALAAGTLYGRGNRCDHRRRRSAGRRARPSGRSTSPASTSLCTSPTISPRGFRTAAARSFSFRRSCRRCSSAAGLAKKRGAGSTNAGRTMPARRDIWALDPQTMEYRPRQPVKLPSLDAAAPLPLPERMRKLFPARTASASFSRPRFRLLCGTPRRSRRRSRIRSTTSIARCNGDTDGRSARSSWPMPSGSTTSRSARRRSAARRAPSSRFCEARAIEKKWSRRTQAPASSISATACSPSRSIRR